MTGISTVSPFRLQVYRLAWIFSLALFAMPPLMIALGHDANDILAEIGFGLFFCASAFSLLARRFSPFGSALFGLLLLSMSICA